MRRWAAATTWVADLLGAAACTKAMFSRKTPQHGSLSTRAPRPQASSTRPAGPSTLDPSVRSATLPNGLTYFAMHRAEPAETLREKLGGVYGLGVSADILREPAPRHRLTIHFTCAPGNVQNLRAVVFDELEHVASVPLDAGEVAKVRSQIERTDEADRRTDAWWLARLGDAYRYGDDFAARNDDGARLARVNADVVRRTARLFFDARHYVLVVMQPRG
jgi:hypothetical protein